MSTSFKKSYIDTKNKKLKLFIADDQPEIRNWLKSIINEFPYIELVGEGDTTLKTIRGIKKAKPEVIILDIRMPGNGGLHVLSKIKTKQPAPIVIIFTAQSEPPYRELSLAIGADYFFNKSEEFDQIESVLGQLESAKQTWVKVSEEDSSKSFTK